MVRNALALQRLGHIGANGVEGAEEGPVRGSQAGRCIGISLRREQRQDRWRPFRADFAQMRAGETANCRIVRHLPQVAVGHGFAVDQNDGTDDIAARG
ncbi:hypothetical protein [Novosphingobium sp. ST904]|uniref:hypothetical protein n=1 Tax=Novosphingobium sp. ST904 TaxID=1684385 RepID=UPI0006C8D09A|nr:hypothetical protein [Novosphingobium sp. ST904]KPH66583.1 hypothetical protein ADT71_05290 [Novosphingobium sp. ST904]